MKSFSLSHCTRNFDVCHVSTSLVLKIQKEDKREGKEGKEVDCGFSHGRITRQSAGSCPHCGMNAFCVLGQCLFVIRGQLELCPLHRVFSSLWMSLDGWFFVFMLLAASPPCHARYAASWEHVSSSRLHLLSSCGFSSSSSLICVIFTSMSSSSVSSCGVDRTLKLSRLCLRAWRATRLPGQRCQPHVVSCHPSISSSPSFSCVVLVCCFLTL